jgi:hypothetical protein
MIILYELFLMSIESYLIGQSATVEARAAFYDLYMQIEEKARAAGQPDIVQQYDC